MTFHIKIRNSFLALVCFFLLLPLPVKGDCLSTSWPQEKSDLQADPSVIYGRLSNGFRYILKQNTEPRNRVAISLNVQAGSLHEDDDQRGIAHFLEHMLFNGTTHFSPGELVEYFQSLGMNFGADANAHTSYDETVYEVLLPKGGREDIEKGLLVLADYARGALLLPEEIDRERGVILAEKRTRDSARYRARMKELAFSMQGTLVPERAIIGILETLENVDQKIMKRYYDAWYRPENMALVMVGDFDPITAQSLIDTRFSPLEAEGPAPSCPDLGSLIEYETPQFFFHQEPEMGHVEVGIETHWNVAPVNDSSAFQIEELKKYLGVLIVQHRFDELAKKRDTPFTGAKIYSGVFQQRFAYGEVSAQADPDKWQESLILLENSLRQALEFGFAEEELERVKGEVLATLESAVLTKNSRNSKQLVTTIIRSLNRNRVLQSPEQEKALLEPALQSISLADVEAAFRSIWAHPTRLVKVNGKSVVAEGDPLQHIAAAYRRGVETAVTQYEVAKTLAFPYLQLKAGSEADIAAEEIFKEIDSKRVVFENGVVLNYKQTSFQENEVQVAVDFGLGKSGSPTPGLSLLADAVIPQSGTGQLTGDELNKVLSGSSVGVGFKTNEASFQWQAKTLNKDLELAFQVLQSLLADPDVDEEAYTVSMERLKLHYDSLAGDVQGAMLLSGNRFLAGGNPFLGMPAWSALSQISIDQLREWYLPAAAGGSLEISVVGDFDESVLIQQAAKYFGALPVRSVKEAEAVTLSFPAAKELELSVPSTIDKGMLVVAWKTDDFWDITRTRGLHLLAEVFSERLRKVVREKLGATYSPRVYNISHRMYKGYGVLQAVLIVNPSQFAELRQEVLQIAGELQKGGIGKGELDRAQGPMVTSLKDMVRTNRYWQNSVLSLSSRYPEQLQWPLSILSGFASFTAADIEKLAAAYLYPEKAAVVTVGPESQ